MPTSSTDAAAPRLPTEIVSEIVQNVLEGNYRWRKDMQSLCLVSKEFLNPCQAVLFRRVTIRPPTEFTEAGEPQGTNLATRFSEVIERTSQLGKYVQTLNYKLSSRINDKTEAPKALACLTELRTLRIEYEETTNSHRYLDWNPQSMKWRRGVQKQYRGLLEAFAKLIASGPLKELVLTNISVPANMIMNATVESLWLDGTAHLCSMTGKEASNTPLSIQHFKLTGGAAWYLGNTVSSGNYPMAFEHLETLSVPMTAEKRAQYAGRHILGKATSLRELRLYTPDNELIEPYEDQHKRKDPIRHIPVQVYTTLTSLVLDLQFNITQQWDIIADPWHGLCHRDSRGIDNSTLSQLKALKDLTIIIGIKGVAWKTMDVDFSFTHSNWKKLDKTLLPGGPEGPFANPKLKRVRIVIATSGNCLSTPKPIADAFGAAVKQRAYRLPWLGSVMKKMRKGEIEAAIDTTVKHDRDCTFTECTYKRNEAKARGRK